MSSKSESRKRRDEAWEKEQEIIQAERNRKEALSMWARINEANNIDDIKDILERLREHLNLE